MLVFWPILYSILGKYSWSSEEKKVYFVVILCHILYMIVSPVGSWIQLNINLSLFIFYLVFQSISKNGEMSFLIIIMLAVTSLSTLMLNIYFLVDFFFLLLTQGFRNFRLALKSSKDVTEHLLLVLLPAGILDYNILLKCPVRLAPFTEQQTFKFVQCFFFFMTQ